MRVELGSALAVLVRLNQQGIAAYDVVHGPARLQVREGAALSCTDGAALEHAPVFELRVWQRGAIGRCGCAMVAAPHPSVPQTAAASSASGAESAATGTTGSEGGAGSKRGRGWGRRRSGSSGSGGAAPGLPSQETAAGGGIRQSGAALPHASLRHQVPAASLAATAAADPHTMAGSQGVGGGESRAVQALLSGGSASAEGEAAEASLTLGGEGCDNSAAAAATLGVLLPPLTGRLDAAAAVVTGVAVRSSSRVANVRVLDSAAPRATGMSDEAAGTFADEALGSSAAASSASIGAKVRADVRCVATGGLR